MLTRHIRTFAGLAATAAAVLAFSSQSIAAPAAPAPTSPCAGTTVDLLPAFKWGSVSSATHYDFWVSGDSGFQTPAYGNGSGPNESQTNNTRATLQNTLADGTYYWKVRGRTAGNAAGAWSTTCSFTVDWSDQPTLTAPADTATVTYPTPLLFTWGAVDGAARYSINVSQASDMSSSLSGFPVTTTATAYSPPSRLDNGTYYWQVTPIDGDSAAHQGTPSEIHSFTWSWPSTNTTLSVTDLDPSPEVYDPQFSWTPIPGAKSYQLEINSDSNFSAQKVCCDDTIISTNYSPTSLLPADTYYWRVRAQDPSGHFGPWVVAPGGLAIPTTFTNNYDTAGVSNLTMVDTSGTSVWQSSPLSTDTPIVQWSATPGAESYQVQVVPYSNSLCQWGTGAPSGWQTQTAATAWTPLGDGLQAGNPFPNSGHPFPSGDSSALSQGTSYCVRVRAQRANDSNNQQVYGAYTYLGGSGNPAFTFTGYPAGSPCTAPCNLTNIGAADYILPLATGNTSLPLFTWKPIAGMQSYFVIVATDTTFQHVIDEAFTHVNAYAPRGGLTTVNYPDTNTTYAWAVLPAQGYDGSSAGGDPTPSGSYPQTFDFHSVQPTPVTPLTGDTVTTQPTFTWTPVNGADHYVLQVATDSGFGNTVGGTPVTTNATSYTGTNFPAGLLYWRVHAIDAGGNGLSWTTTQQFTKTFAAPTFTGNGTTYTDPTTTDGIPTLQWDAMPGATSYEVKIYHGSSSAEVDQTLDSTAFAPTSLGGTGHFTWTVTARYPTSGGDVASAPSSTQAFDRSIAAPSGLTGGTGTQHNMLLSWNPKPGAAHYAVQLATDNTFSSVFDDYGFNAPENPELAPNLTAGQYSEGGTLFWRIATVDADGNQGAWSAAQAISLPVQIHGSSSAGAILHKANSSVTVYAKTAAGGKISGVKISVKGCGVTATSKTTASGGSAKFKLHPTKTGTVTFTLTRSGYVSTTVTLTSY